MTAKIFASNKNILFFILFDILLLDCAIISHSPSSPFYVQKLNLNYRVSRKILRGAEHGSSTPVCSQGWQEVASASQDSALKIHSCSALWHKWPETSMQMSTLILTNSEEAVEKYCWNLGLMVLAGRTAGHIWTDLGVTERKIFAFTLHLYELTFTDSSVVWEGGKSQEKLLSGKQWDYTAFLAKAAL